MSPPPDSLLKVDPGTRLFRFPMGDGEAFLKWYSYDAWYLQLRARFAPSRARREFRVLEELSRRGLPTLQPLAFGEVDRGPWRESSYLLTVYQPEATTLEAFLDAEPPRAARRAVLDAVAGLVARMHAAGFAHGTLFPRNLMLTGADGTGEPRIFDAPFGRFGAGPVGTRARADDLACLLRFGSPVVTAAERARFLRVYLGRGGGEGWGPEGRALARSVLASSAFTRSIRKKFLFHWGRLTR